jgi:AcrR family transcriptional regulator
MLYVNQIFLMILYMARRSKEESEKTRAHILKQARKELADGGYDHLSLEALARDCGVTRGAVYHHFKNKRGLFREIVELLSREMGETIYDTAASGPSGGEDGKEALMLGARGFLSASQSQEYQRIILTDAAAVLGMEEWRKIDDEYTTSTLIEVFTQISGREEGAQALAEAFSGAMNQLSRWMGREGDMDRAYAALEKMLMFID